MPAPARFRRSERRDIIRIIERTTGERIVMKNKKSALYIAQSSAIAAIYVVLTMLFAPISFGAVQVRVAEALTILPLFTSAAIPGLFVGCLLANLLGGGVIWDVVFGSLATLVGAALGFVLRRNRWLVPIPAVAANTIVVPLVLRYGYGIEIPLALMALYIAVGEIAGSYLLGELLAGILLRRKKQIFKD